MFKGASILALIYFVQRYIGLGDMLKAQAEGGLGRNAILQFLNNVFPFLSAGYTLPLLIAATVLLIGIVVFSKTYLKRVTARPKAVEDIISVLDRTYDGNKPRAIGSFVLYQFVLSLVGFLGAAASGALLVTGLLVTVIAPLMAASLPAIYAGAVFTALVSVAAKSIMLLWEPPPRPRYS